MKRNFLTLIILVLVISVATCFMLTGCNKPNQEPTNSSELETSRKQPSTSSEDPTNSSSEDPVNSSTDTPTSSSSTDVPTSSSSEDVPTSSEAPRDSDTPIYNSAN